MINIMPGYEEQNKANLLNYFIPVVDHAHWIKKGSAWRREGMSWRKVGTILKEDWACWLISIWSERIIQPIEDWVLINWNVIGSQSTLVSLQSFDSQYAGFVDLLSTTLLCTKMQINQIPLLCVDQPFAHWVKEPVSGHQWFFFKKTAWNSSKAYWSWFLLVSQIFQTFFISGRHWNCFFFFFLQVYF